jgi:hypothetical protein
MQDADIVKRINGNGFGGGMLSGFAEAFQGVLHKNNKATEIAMHTIDHHLKRESKSISPLIERIHLLLTNNKVDIDKSRLYKILMRHEFWDVMSYAHFTDGKVVPPIFKTAVNFLSDYKEMTWVPSMPSRLHEINYYDNILSAMFGIVASYNDPIRAFHNEPVSVDNLVNPKWLFCRLQSIEKFMIYKWSKIINRNDIDDVFNKEAQKVSLLSTDCFDHKNMLIVFNVMDRLKKTDHGDIVRTLAPVLPADNLFIILMKSTLYCIGRHVRRGTTHKLNKFESMLSPMWTDREEPPHKFSIFGNFP